MVRAILEFKKRDFVWIGLIVVLLSVGFGYAQWDSSKAMFHDSVDVKITIDSVDYSLQNASDLGLLGGGGVDVYDIDGTETSVYTKYFTGTLDAGSETLIVHGIADATDKILHVSAAVYVSTVGRTDYVTGDSHTVSAAVQSWKIGYGSTNLKFTSVGTDVRGQKYRIKVEYML